MNMNRLLLIGALLAPGLAGCSLDASSASAPSGSPAAAQTQASPRPTNDVAKRLSEALSYFNSTQEELDAFLNQGDPTLPQRILNVSRAGANSYNLNVHLQYVLAYLAYEKASRARFAQLCDDLRFVVVSDNESGYTFARIHENVCTQGYNEAIPTTSPTASQGNQ